MDAVGAQIIFLNNNGRLSQDLLNQLVNSFPFNKTPNNGTDLEFTFNGTSKGHIILESNYQWHEKPFLLGQDTQFPHPTFSTYNGSISFGTYSIATPINNIRACKSIYFFFDSTKEVTIYYCRFARSFPVYLFNSKIQSARHCAARFVCTRHSRASQT